MSESSFQFRTLKEQWNDFLARYQRGRQIPSDHYEDVRQAFFSGAFVGLVIGETLAGEKEMDDLTVEQRIELLAHFHAEIKATLKWYGPKKPAK